MANIDLTVTYSDGTKEKGNQKSSYFVRIAD